MNTLPTEIVRMIMTYRGTDTFEALSHEMDTTKKATAKWRTSMLDRIVKADIDDESITHKEYLLLTRALNRKCPKACPKVKGGIAFHPDA
jgi:hypothetical protein